MSAVAELRAALRKGLEGVTPGPWDIAYDADEAEDVPLEIVSADDWDTRVCFPTSNGLQTAKHLARCSPENIAALLDALEAAEARAEELEKALARLGSTEAFGLPRAVKLPQDDELIARIDFARAALSHTLTEEGSK